MTQTSCDPAAAPIVFTVKQFAERHAWPTERAIRHLVFHADKNGFNKCIRRIGSRVLIIEQDFFEWVNAQSGGCR